MKKKTLFFSFIVLGLLILSSCNTPGNDNDKTRFTEDNVIEVIYFHFTRRCMTCNAVESVAKETVDALNDQNIMFSDYNLDNEAGQEEAEKMQVSGQSLLIVNGTSKVNITNEAFMHARSNPGKLKNIIEAEIEKFQ
jgi:hypothetical protein